MSTTLSVLPIIQRYLSWSGWPTWLLFGCIGCSLNILLFSRRQFRGTSCCLCKTLAMRVIETSRFPLDFLSASFPMLVFLNISLVPTIYAFNHPNLFNTVSAFCKVRNYLLQSSVMMYRWFMTAACIDRYIHTSPNLRLQQFIDIRLTLRVIGVIFFLWLVLPFHQLVWNDVQNNLCVFIDTSVSIYNGFFAIIFGGLLPPSIMLVCALLIRKNLAARRARRHHRQVVLPNTSGEQQKHPLRSRDQQALAMLYLQMFVYIISNLPWTLNLVYVAFTRSMSKSTDHLLIDAFLRFLVEFISCIYPVLSFYMYTLISRTFREELLRILYLNRRVRPMM